MIPGVRIGPKGVEMVDVLQKNIENKFKKMFILKNRFDIITVTSVKAFLDSEDLGEFMISEWVTMAGSNF